MKRPKISYLPTALINLAVAVALAAPLGISVPAAYAASDPLINEYVANTTGTDNYEFLEVFGDASTDYSDFTLLEIEGDGDSAGIIDGAWDLGSTGADGFWMAGFFSNEIENGTITLLLVETFSGAAGDDLDTDNDGAFDVTPWARIVDDVAVHDGGSSDVVYSAVVLEEYYDGMQYAPGGASRIPDGTDTDTADDWVRNDFDLAGIPGEVGSPACGEALNTPGAPNELALPGAPAVLTLPEIQGEGEASAYAGEFVQTEGVVTLLNGSRSSFWLQDPAGDGDPATSDGVFVSGGRYPVIGPKAEVGDHIRLTAYVDELQYYPALPLTRLEDVCVVEVLSTGNPLPAPVPLVDLPNVSMLEGIAFWEPLEGMLVSVSNAIVTAPTSNYYEFGMLTQTDAAAFSGYKYLSSQILIRSLGGENVDYNPERIMVDDYSLSAPIVVQPGDRVHSLVGAVDYTFGMYKLQPASWDIATQDLPEAPVSKRMGPSGDTTITTFNVENLFDLEVGITVDAIGKVGEDPDYEWGSGDTSTQDNTIRRKDTVCQGDSESGDDFDPAVEWVGFAKDTLDGLGTHSTTCGLASGLLFSEYVEGGGYNKAVEIYNGTGGPVDLDDGDYVLEIYFNGNTAPGQVIDLSGVIANGDTYVIAHPSADGVVLAAADLIDDGVLFNGDDAVLLRQSPKDDAGSTPTPEALEKQLTKLALAIEIEMQLPDILIAQEVENTAILQELGDRVNASAGTAYTAVSYETSDARGIEVGFLWDADRVTLVDSYQMTGLDVEAAFGPSSPSPGREPLVGVFDIGGRQLTIVGNHLKSKSGDDALFGVNWPPIRITEVQRKAQARVVRDFVNTILAADPRALVMVAGDMNDFQFSEPGEGPDNPVAIMEGEYGEVPLINLIRLELPAERFTYVYDGNSQVLDHMLVSPALLLHLRGVDILHFNTSVPATFGDDPTTPLHCSDHDPVEGRFQFSWSVRPWRATWRRE